MYLEQASHGLFAFSMATVKASAAWVYIEREYYGHKWKEYRVEMCMNKRKPTEWRMRNKLKMFDFKQTLLII